MFVAAIGGLLSALNDLANESRCGGGRISGIPRSLRRFVAESLRS